jgi:membrane-bound serine protease (ClpP class)
MRLPGLAALFCFAAVHAEGPPALLMTVNGAIGPAAVEYVRHGLARAGQRQAVLAVIEIDTPGGLDTAMRAIVKDILASPVPVAVYVAPKGARAASAGTYILYAAHVAAMAPATNLGAATPVQIGASPPPAKPVSKEGDKKAETDSAAAPADTMTRKQVHDAAAYLRGLAQFRGRNAEWGEKAVRESVSLSAEEAVRRQVVDLVAVDVADLLARVDGRKVAAEGGERVLHTRAAPVEEFPPDWRIRLLAAISDPSLALILMLVGAWGIFFEFSNPGLVAPGVVGAISLALGFFGLQLLPINYSGLLLIVLGIGFMVAEAFLPSFGSLGIGGVVAFVAGGLMLIDGEGSGFAVPVAQLDGLAAASALFMVLVGRLALRARRRPRLGGSEELLGSPAEVVSWADGRGWMRVRGELWQGRAETEMTPGQRVRVDGVDGLTLHVVANGPGGE